MVLRFLVLPSAFLALVVAGCAWQRVEAPPEYQAEEIGITVGLKPSDSAHARGLAPDLATELETIGEFEKVIYPYRPGDKVDCLFEFDATGGAEGRAVGAGVATGLTFGLAGAVVGPAVLMKYDVDYHLTNGRTVVARDRVHVESKAEFGAFADTTEVAMKHAALQNRKIAIAIAEKLQANRKAIEEVCTGYSQEVIR